MAFSKKRVKVVKKVAESKGDKVKVVRAQAAPPVPEKIVIVAGPSFGNAMKFVLFGATLGAAATYTLLANRKAAGAAGTDAVSEGLSAGGAKDNPEQIAERISKLSARAKKLAVRTRNTVTTASVVLGPVVAQAVAEGRRAAVDAQRDLEEELKNPPTPAKPEAKPDVAAEQA